jgi:hypothetical protein
LFTVTSSDFVTPPAVAVNWPDPATDAVACTLAVVAPGDTVIDVGADRIGTSR